MRKGEIAAVVFITSKPVDAFVKGRWEHSWEFLPVKYESKLEDYYLPAVLEAAEYPSLIKQGERVETIAVPTALVSFNWPAKTSRYQRVARFVDMLFSRIDKLHPRTGLRPEMEVDQPWPQQSLVSSCFCSGAGMAGSSVTPSAGFAMRGPA